MERGDFVGVAGRVMRTRKGELSVEASEALITLKLIAKPVSLTAGALDFAKLSEGIADTSGIEASRFSKDAVEKLIRERQQADKMAEGRLFNFEIDTLFITAMLTIVGFSVHDTIVVFDRVRENRVRHSGEPFAEIVNHSILQTAGRSINTSLTVVFTLLALFLFGGAAIHSFVLALLIGIISGTYSSIFNASPLLVDWHLWDERRRARQLSRQRSPQARPA